MDQQNEIMQMQVEANIVRLLNALYKDLQTSDRPEAEDHLGHIAEMKAFWEGDAGSKDEQRRMVLQNPGPKNHTIYITIGVLVNFGDAENPDNPYSSESISDALGDALKCEVCGNWHWNQDICGMDEAWLDDVSEKEVTPEMMYEGDPCIEFIDEKGNCAYEKCGNGECPYKKEVSK